MSTQTHSVPILGLSGAGGEALALSHTLEEIDGIVTFWVNKGTEVAYVTLDPELILMREVVRVIEECGYDAGMCRGP